MARTAEDLQKGYEIRFSEISEYRNAVWKLIIGQFLQGKIGQDKVILDLGCGWGEFINNIQARAKFGMDLNPGCGNHVSSDVIFLQQDCSKRWDLEDESLDVVFTSNFFEHLPTKQSLLDTLRQAARCLKPCGRLFCLGPNVKYVGHNYWDFFDHELALSHLSLAEALKLVDFKIVSSLPKFLPYTMAGGSPPPLLLVKLYLRLPILWPVFGKQFFVVAEKQANKK